MIIKSIDIYKYFLPLYFPIKIANKIIHNREGIILKFSDENNSIGFGEISPLPGLHKENLLQVIEQIENFSGKILKMKISDKKDLFNTDFKLHKLNLYPSVQFGIESALCSLIATKNNIKIFDIFKVNKNNSIKINVLLSGTLDQIIKKTKKSLVEGFTTFKLKVGRNSIEDDIVTLNSVIELIKSKGSLRLDANQAWTLEQALHFFRNIDLSKIEYIEEPLKDYKRLPQLMNEINIPIAIDENIHTIDLQAKIPIDVKAMVIKPAVIGGINKSIEYIKYAEDNGIKPIISDTFQSGVGLSFLIALANLIQQKPAMGFDTYSWLKKDIIKNRFQFQNEKIFYQTPDIAYSSLTKLY